MLTAKEFGVDRRWIREWREDWYMLQQNMIGEKKTKRKLHQGREVRSIEIDQAVLLFLDEERAEGRVVRNKDLRQKANEIAGGLGLQDFSASQMWLKRWEQRHSVCTRKSTHTSQKVPDDFEEHLFDNFRVSILWQKSTWLPTTFHSEYGPNDGSFWYGPQSYKWAKRGEASENQDCKRPKTGIYCGSVCICQWCKIPSHNCLEGEKWAHPTVCFSQPSNSCKCSYQATRNGRMTRESLQMWVEQVVGEMDHRRLPVPDSYRAHQTPQIRQALNERHVYVVFVPPDCTELAQPVDVGIAKPFKHHVRDQWVQWMRHPCPLTAAGNLTQPTRQDVITWVSQAWEGVPEETICTYFLRCALSNAMDGSEDDQALEWFPNEMDGILPQEAAAEEQDEYDESSNDDEEEADRFGFFE